MQELTARQEAHTEKRRFWQEHLDAWKAGGQNQSAYCRRHQLSFHSFRYWKKKLSTDQACPVSFVRVYPSQVLPNAGGGNPLHLILGPYKIEVPAGFDPATLKLLLNTLGRL